MSKDEVKEKVRPLLNNRTLIAIVMLMVGGGTSTGINAMRDEPRDYSADILALQIQMARVETKLDILMESRDTRKVSAIMPR